MNAKSILLTIAVLFTAHTFASSVPHKDAALDRALQGAWCNSDDGGKNCWGFDDFNKGQVQSCGTFPETRSPFTGRSSYLVNGNKVCHVVEESSIPDLLKPGERFCFEVLEINDRIQRFKDTDSEEITVIYRIPRESIKCPARK